MSHHILIAYDEGSCKTAPFDILQHDAGKKKNSHSAFIHILMMPAGSYNESVENR
jgi:hypothetical protein